MIRATVTILFMCSVGMTLGACQTSAPSRRVVAAATPEEKQASLDRVKLLQGKWKASDGKGEMQGETTFTVGGGGSTVREVMFAGTEHEMTNMYHMDGSSIVCTHYCAVGNQPRMAAEALPAAGASSVSVAPSDTIKFKLVSVSNLRAPDETCMGEMWLTFRDANTVDQRWKSFKGNTVESDFVLTLTRVQ